MFTYQCPQCGKAFTTEAPAQSVQCPYCQQVFQPAPQQPQQGFAPQQPYGPQQAYGQQQPYGPQPIGVFDEGPSGKSRGVAALLCFLLGGLGAHYFYLNKVGGGLICLALTACTCGIWGIILLIQTIKFFTMSQEEFETKFVNSQSTFPLF